MMFNRWTTLLRNQVVATVLLLLFLVPLLFGGSDVNRGNQVTLYGFLGLILFSVWLLRAQDRITLPRLRGLVLSGPNLAILLFLGWSFISVLNSPEPIYSQYAFVQLAFGVLLYAMVVYQFRHREQVKALLSTVLVLGVALVLHALYLDKGQLLTTRGLAGSFHDRQLFGAFLLLFLPVMLGVAAGTRNRVWKSCAQLASIIVLGAILMTKCRSAWLGVAVAIGVFLLLSVLYVWKLQMLKQKKHELLITPILGVVVLGIFVTFTRMDAPIQRRAATFSAVQQDDSVKDRLNLAQVAWRVFSARPITGWGPGSYAVVQSRFTQDSRSEAIIRQMGPSLTESPHNTYLQVAAEQGAPGLIFYVAILVTFFVTGVRALPRMDRGLRKYTLIGSLAALAGQAVDGIANPGWMYPEVSTFFWLILGVGMCAAGLGQEWESEQKTQDRPVLGVPRFLFRGVRTAMLGCAVLVAGAHLWNLNITAASAGAPPLPGGGGGGGNGGNQNRPIYADFITRLDVDFLNDQINPPTAFDVNAGAIPLDRLATFKIYALTDDRRFFADVTTERKYIKFKLIGLKGKFYYSESSNIPRFFFSPKKKMAGKTGVIEISYKCTKPTEIFKTRFTLTVLPDNDFIDQSAGIVSRANRNQQNKRPAGASQLDWLAPELLKQALPVPDADVEYVDAE